MHTIAQARQQLPQLVHLAEQGQALVLTRRGKPVAVLQSFQAYESMRQGQEKKGDWLDSVLQWRELTALEGVAWLDAEAAVLRSTEAIDTPDWTAAIEPVVGAAKVKAKKRPA